MKSMWIFFFMASLILFGCGDANVRFTHPQPSGSKTLDKFPRSLQSTLTLSSDTTIVGYFDIEYPRKTENGMSLDAINNIQITETSVLNRLQGSITLDFRTIEDSAKKAQYNQEYRLDSLILEHYQRPSYSYDLVSKIDSVLVYEFNLVDTMFSSSKTNVMKRFKNDIYLNIQTVGGSWQVFKMSNPSKSNVVKWCYITEKDETVLKRIMKQNNENIENEFLSPSAKTMKQFYKMNGFEECLELIKVED